MACKLYVFVDKILVGTYYNVRSACLKH